MQPRPRSRDRRFLGDRRLPPRRRLFELADRGTRSCCKRFPARPRRPSPGTNKKVAALVSTLLDRPNGAHEPVILGMVPGAKGSHGSPRFFPVSLESEAHHLRSFITISGPFARDACQVVAPCRTSSVTTRPTSSSLIQS
jgi:hypothetical protein